MGCHGCVEGMLQVLSVWMCAQVEGGVLAAVMEAGLPRGAAAGARLLLEGSGQRGKISVRVRAVGTCRKKKKKMGCALVIAHFYCIIFYYIFIFIT